MIFSDSPSQKALERMMTQVKGFPPRGSGVMVLRRFEYTAEMCDCRLCLYYNRKKKCTVSQCPCIEERIVAGAADRSEVMAETMKNIHNAAFHRRLNQFINESEELHMNFRNEKHRLAFVEAIRKLDKKNFALMSALYLLTAEHKLWMQIRNFVERNEIKFDSFKPKDSTENGYTLLCCAKDLYQSTASRNNCIDGGLIMRKESTANKSIRSRSIYSKLLIRFLVCGYLFGLSILQCIQIPLQDEINHTVVTVANIIFVILCIYSIIIPLEPEDEMVHKVQFTRDYTG